MKSVIKLLLLAGLMISPVAWGQGAHLKGSQYAELGVSGSTLGIGPAVAYGYHLNYAWSLRAQVNGEFGGYRGIQYRSIGLDLQGVWGVVRKRKWGYFSVRGGLSGAYDWVDAFAFEGSQTAAGWKYGLSLGLEAEWNLAPGWALSTALEQRGYLNYAFGRFRALAVLGIRYYWQ